jgi:GTPase
VYLVVNKIDGLEVEVVTAEFHRLGLGAPIPIAASHGRGVAALMSLVLAEIPAGEEGETERDKGLTVSLIGRPNVGKSTLINRLLGEERVVVFDQPGTTRDSIYIPFERRGEHYTLIDTAGVRKRGKVKETLEKFSIVKTLQAIDDAAVVIFLIDAQEGLTEQDLHLLGFVLEAGRGLVIAVNKWDDLSTEARERVRYQIDRKLTFVNFARLHFISALHGTGVGDLFKFVQEAYRSATRKLSTPKMTEILQAAVQQHAPPRGGSGPIKLRYAHVGGHNPPVIVIHGKQVDSIPEAYKRYLINFYRERLKLIGTPIRIEFKSGENPFAGKRNTLTPRQLHKRKRLIQHHKKKDKK